MLLSTLDRHNSSKRNAVISGRVSTCHLSLTMLFSSTIICFLYHLHVFVKLCVCWFLCLFLLYVCGYELTKTTTTVIYFGALLLQHGVNDRLNSFEFSAYYYPTITLLGDVIMCLMISILKTWPWTEGGASLIQCHALQIVQNAVAILCMHIDILQMAMGNQHCHSILQQFGAKLRTRMGL